MRELPRLALQCFGPPTALLDGHPAPPHVLWSKHLALLIYLALSPNRTRTRGHLVGLLWPETREDKAKHSLNVALNRLRLELGSGRITSGRSGLTLLDGALDVDALQFDALADHAPEQAVALARGDFLEGFDLEGAHAFEEWATERRTHYRTRVTAALLSAGERELAAAHYSDALAAGRRALARDPYAERAVTLVMQAAALSGDVADALAAFHEFTTRIAAEISERPSRNLCDLADRIRTGRWRSPGPATPEEREPRPALVGRESLHRTVFDLVAAGTSHGPRTLLIVGDPGTGKTRLLRECLDRVALDGATIAVARPLETDQDAPWSMLRALLRGGLLRAPGRAAADPGSLDLLGRLVPELTERAPGPPPGDVAQVGAALASLLAALAGERAVGVGIHDAQYSDDASLDALGATVAQLPRLPLVAVLTATPMWDQAPPGLLRLRAEIGRSLSGLEARLEPLSQADTRRLVLAGSAWCRDDAERERLARRVFFETNGNPFLITSLLRALADASSLRAEALAWPAPGATDETPLPISVPQLARRAITARVARLDETTRRVLQAATIGAVAIDVELVAALTGLARPEVEDTLAVLERARLVGFEGDRYVIAAPLIAQVVLAEWLLPGKRRTLGERAIAALAARSDIESRLLCAQLATTITPGPASFDEAMAVAQTALAGGMRRSAHQGLAAAARGLPPGDETRRRTLEEFRARLAST